MFCRYCGTKVPDGSANCPGCGKAVANKAPASSANPFAQNPQPFNSAQNSPYPQNTQPFNGTQNSPYPQNAPGPQGYPQNYNYGAPMGGAGFGPRMNNFGGGLPSFRIGRRTIQLSVGLLLVPVMIIFLIIGMVGINTFDTVKLKEKEWGETVSIKFSLSDIDFDADDFFLTMVVKILAIICIFGTIAVLLLGIYKFIRADVESAVKMVGVAGIIMAIGYMFTIINGFYMKGVFNDEGGSKIKGGASITAWIWFLLMAAVAFGAFIVSSQEEQKLAMKAAEGERNSRFGSTY